MIDIFHSLYITFGGGGSPPIPHSLLLHIWLPFPHSLGNITNYWLKRVSITKFPLHAISSLISSPLPSPTPSCSLLPPPPPHLTLLENIATLLIIDYKRFLSLIFCFMPFFFSNLPTLPILYSFTHYPPPSSHPPGPLLVILVVT